MILVNINKISYDPNSKGYLVMLKALEDNNCLEILISTKDAKQISLAKEGVNLPRPSTHDLLLDIINSFDIKLKKIIITDYKGSTYYAKLLLYNTNLGEIVIDSRPSDAIVLSLRSNSPLYINKNLLALDLSSTDDAYPQEILDSNDHEDDDIKVLLENLNKALNKAVMVEEYEAAAKLRDQINSLIKD